MIRETIERGWKLEEFRHSSCAIEVKNRLKMPEVFETSSVNPNLVMEDHSYGKGGIKILHLVRNGKKFVGDLMSLIGVVVGSSIKKILRIS